MIEYAIIGGTGIYSMSEDIWERRIDTAYGTIDLDIISFEGLEIVFLPRHGKGHGTPPHKVNYLANMKALEQLGVKYVLATCAVGSCRAHLLPGNVVVVKDFMDFTKIRPLTYYEGATGVKHVEMTDPYCKNLRTKLEALAPIFDVELKDDVVYVCTEGPRFETAAEIRMFKNNGGDVVGMTNVPEVVLAKELGMCYGAVGIITNMCTGVTGEAIGLHEIGESVERNKENLTNLFVEIFKGRLNQDACRCNASLIEL